ncbi:MAG TPA: cytochrome c-type biogenesis protein CcmH [Myxococcota bacterium]
MRPYAVRPFAAPAFPRRLGPGARAVRRSWVSALAVAALLGALLGGGAPEARAAERPYAIELYNGLMSPYCPGRTLMDCPSEQAAALRQWIAEQERAGRSREEVEEQLYREYGDVILQAPRAEGFGLAAYVFPVIAFFLGGAIVWRFLRRQGGGAPLPAGPRAPLDPEIERRIDEELRA